MHKVLVDYEIQSKLFTITSDSASNMKTMAEELALLIPTFDPDQHWIRCFAHTLNLAVTAMLNEGFTNQAPTNEESVYLLRAREDHEDNQDVESAIGHVTRDSNPLNRLRAGIVRIR